MRRPGRAQIQKVFQIGWKDIQQIIIRANFAAGCSLLLPRPAVAARRAAVKAVAAAVAVPAAAEVVADSMPRRAWPVCLPLHVTKFEALLKSECHRGLL